MAQSDRTISLLSNLTGRRGDIERLLAPGHVAVALHPEVASNPQAQLIFSFSVNLLARLYPLVQKLEVELPTNVPLKAPIPRWCDAILDGHISRFLQALNADVHWRVGEKTNEVSDCSLLLGLTGMLQKNAVFVGSDGWNAYLSSEGPAAVGTEVNPVGAYAAACLGVAEVSKRLLYPHRELFKGIPILPIDGRLAFSTFTYQTGSSEPNPPLESSIDLDRLTIVGLGAGGSTALYALASLPDLRGVLNLIEPDEIAETNLNRYVHADSKDASTQRLKTDAARTLLDKFAGLDIETFPVSFRKASAQLAMEDYRYVLAAVHSREARRELQYETPKVLWDGGATEDGDFRVWRHILGTTDCMHCKHPVSGQDPERESASQLTKLLGLDSEAWLRKIRDNEQFAKEEIMAIRAHVAGQRLSFDLPALGERHGDWEKAQCGRLPLPDVDEEIPIPFAPVMAGVLLAGEVIKERCYPEAVLDSYYGNTLLGRFMEKVRPNRRLPRRDCAFCRDKAYLDQYRRRWAEPTPPHLPLGSSLH